MAKAEGQSRRTGHSARDSGDAGFAALPVPHRARSGSDRSGQGAQDLRHRTGVAAELLPVEFDAGRRAARVWPKRASCARPAVLDAQVKRMLADRALGRARRQFRRPVAGDPQSRQRQARSAEVPGLGAGAARRDEDGDADVLRSTCCARTGRCPSSSTPSTRSSTSGWRSTTASRASRARSSAASISTTDQRGGILSQASVLTVSSYPTRTSPVIRGKYVLQNILGAPPPPPPPDVPALDEEAGRQRRLAAAAAGEASLERRLRLLPQPDGRARLRPGELRRHRQVAHDGRQVPGRCQRHAAERQVVFDAGRDAGRCCKDELPEFCALPDREDADLLRWAAAWSDTTAGPSRRSTGSWRRPDISFRR